MSRRDRIRETNRRKAWKKARQRAHRVPEAVTVAGHVPAEPTVQDLPVPMDTETRGMVTRIRDALAEWW